MVSFEKLFLYGTIFPITSFGECYDWMVNDKLVMDKSDQDQNQSYGWIKCVTWSQNLQEVRFFKKGEKNKSVYKVSEKLPEKSILKSKEFCKLGKEESKGKDNYLSSKVINNDNTKVENESNLSKKELRKVRRRERNKAKT